MTAEETADKIIQSWLDARWNKGRYFDANARANFEKLLDLDLLKAAIIEEMKDAN